MSNGGSPTFSPASGPSQTAAGVGASPLAANPDAGDLS